MFDLTERESLAALMDLVLNMLREATGIAGEGLHPEASFHEIGLNSLAILNFNERIRPLFADLNKTLLFDCRCVREVAQHLQQHHARDCARYLQSLTPDTSPPLSKETTLEIDAWPLLPRLDAQAARQEGDIAVVGLHGRFPGADNLDTFWRNLLEGVDSVGEIPEDRWSLEGFFAEGTASRSSGQSYAKWGGFLDGIDQFDAQFFGIPPREAACLDPQERLFLECAWHALEDSGHLGERSQLLRQANGSLDVGVFVGITSNTFPLLGPALWQAGSTAIPSGLPWSVANRVSFALDLCGPSLAIDTACSSSLTALHMAIDSLRKNQCRAALVGGVNLYTHPAKYVQLCQQHMLSPTGRCHAFGSQADGFVPGEGVAALLLKPLAAARRDGDRILAVIKGSAINHGGRTNGYTVPSANSQATLIAQALADAGVEGRSISYIEAHGTGTRLGDPIELQGLKQALKQADGALPCHVGSVKANIGHLEAAAGMASLTKVVLQLQYRHLAASLHADTLNPDADLDHTHLRINQSAQPWSAGETPRRAGVSSFGAGGANAHVIVEQAPDAQPRRAMGGVTVFPLSARTGPQLRTQAQQLLDWLKREPETDLQALAYTLQCCRPVFEHRFAVPADSLLALQTRLTHFLAEAASGSRQWHQGRVLPGSARPEDATNDQPAEALSAAWVAGQMGEWSHLWREAPTPVAAPLYPFIKERHWLPDVGTPTDSRRQILTLSPEQFFLRDHVIQGSPVLPAAAYIDFCRQHAEDHGLSLPLELHKLTWASPITFPDGQQRRIEGRSEPRDGVVHMSFQPLPGKDGASSFRGQCRALPPIATATGTSLQQLRSQCAQPLTLEALYPTLERLGIAYGPTFRCIAAAWTGDGQALTEVLWRSEQRRNEPLSALDPALLDAVLQSAFVTALGAGATIEATYVPYACQSLKCYGPLTERLFVQVRPHANEAGAMRFYDFRVFAESGEVLLDIEHFAFRLYQPPAADAVHLLEPFWHDAPPPVPSATPSMLLISHDGELVQHLSAELQDNTWQVMSAEDFRYRDPRMIEANLLDPRHVDLLLRLLDARQVPLQTLTFDVLSPRPSSAQPGLEVIGLDDATYVARVLRHVCQALPAPRLHVKVLVRSGPATAIEGLLRSVVQEIPSLSACIIELSGELGRDRYQALSQELLAAPQPGVVRIRLTQEQRQLSALRFVQPSSAPSPAQLVAGDVLVITGGLGAVGRALTEALARVGGLRLALIGRRALSDLDGEWLHSLQALGAADARYWQADCAASGPLHTVLATIRQGFGACHGIIHCAGVLQDAFFLRQQPQDWDAVLRGKTLAAQLLDQATAQDPLKLFMVCSSLAGVYGNVGQSAYALANAWLDRFIQDREQRCIRGERQGHSLSLAWPLWQTEHGMQAPEQVRQWLASNGLSLLAQAQGVATFMASLAMPQSVLIPVSGKRDAIARLFQIQSEIPMVTPSNPAMPEPAQPPSDRQPQLLAYLARQLADVTATALDKVDPDTSLEVFGLDSILVMELNSRLETHFPELSKTVLFEVRSLRELAHLLQTEHASQVARLLPADVPHSAPSAILPSPSSEIPLPAAPPPDERQDIAIIGLAGRYPGARDPQALWQHLAAGDDLICEVPGRWEQPEGDNRLYARWGGFIEDFDCFDPLFFGISPRDAERMDPQERLFLQTAWHAVEDAGYTPQTLSGARLPGVPRRSVAVIAGVMYGEYQFHGASSWPERPATLTNSSYASIANRVSFCLDLEGPSFAIDSMCSSSLTSLHLACDLIRSGSCDMALAGGVNLSSHPYKYRMLCELNFASTQGQCRSFGADGDGYVPGEGVGVTLLKPLKDALRDGDHIHGIIRGSELNHGGRTSGYTVPNADAQAQVIGRALNRSGLAPDRLGYIEAHGTGTSLGDPIEIRGLGKALADRVPAEWQCPIGSIKANIGHLESAAGMAALTKVLLQFKHQQLAPSIHARPLNPNIDFDKTPFVVQQRLADWPARTNAQGQDLPRVAAISSFGAGGANAHLIVEEALAVPAAPATGAQAFVFSARGDGQLRGYLQRFVDFLEHERALAHAQPAHYLGRQRFTTADVANTLLSGRQRFEEARLVVIAEDFDALRQALGQWLMRPGTADTEPLLTSPSPDSACVTLARVWLAGHASAPSGPWRKVPLPGYEFLRRRYWVTPAPTPVPTLTPEPPPVSIEVEINKAAATPKDILDQLARREITQEQARRLLKAMI